MASCRTIGGVRYDLTPSKATGPCGRGRQPAEQKTAPKASQADRLQKVAREWAEAEALKLGSSGPLPVWLPPFEQARKLAVAAGAVGGGESVQRLAGEHWQYLRAQRRSVSKPKAPKVEPPKDVITSDLQKRIDAARAVLERAPEPMTKRAIGEAAGLGHDAEWEVEQLIKQRLVRHAKHQPGWQVDKRFEYVGLGKSPKTTHANLYVETAGGMDPRVRDYDRRRQKAVALPKSIDPSSARKGERVSVFYYGDSDPNHAVLIGLPGDAAQYGVDKEPTVHFESGSSAGMNRFASWKQIYPGWLNRSINWKPWKG